MDDDEEDDGLGGDDDEEDESTPAAIEDDLEASDAEDDDWEGIESDEDAESGSEAGSQSEGEDGGGLAWDALFEQAVGASEKPEPKRPVVDRSSDFEDMSGDEDDLSIDVDGEQPKVSSKAAGKKSPFSFPLLGYRSFADLACPSQPARSTMSRQTTRKKKRRPTRSRRPV